MVLADRGDGEGQEGELLGFEREHQRVASRDYWDALSGSASSFRHQIGIGPIGETALPGFRWAAERLSRLGRDAHGNWKQSHLHTPLGNHVWP